MGTEEYQRADPSAQRGTCMMFFKYARDSYLRAKEGRLSKFLTMPRGAKRAVVIKLDIILFSLSVFISFYLRLGEWDFLSWAFLKFYLAAFALAALVMHFTGAYKAIFRFVGAGMIQGIFRAYVFYGLSIMLLFGVIGLPGVPRTVSLIQPLVFFAFVVALRTFIGFVVLEVTGRGIDINKPSKVLVYGAGVSGQAVAQSLRKDARYQLVGYVDDDTRLSGQRLDGVSVFSSHEIEDVLRRTGAEIILLAIPKSSRARHRQIINAISKYPVEVRILPPMSEVLDGHITLDQIRPIRVEDLLGRDPVAPDELLMARTLTGKVVLVTGAGGSIGSELCRQIVHQRPSRLILAEMTEHALYSIHKELELICDSKGLQVDLVPELVNVSRQKSTERLLARYRPSTVYHAAAYKHVPLVEANVLEGMRNNIAGTMFCALASISHGVSDFILISTDKAVRPTNVMGASKRVCELILQSLSATSSGTNFAIVRFGNVLGSSGSVVPYFTSQIQSGGPITLTHRDITRFFMTIPEAAQLVIQSAGMAEGGEVYLLDMGKPMKIYDLAKTMIRLSGLSIKDQNNPDGDIEIVEVGLRPGEKLFEELLIDASAEPTQHPRIMRARERTIPFDTLNCELTRLLEFIDEGDRSAALAVLHYLVPELVRRDAAKNGEVRVTLPADDITNSELPC